MLTFEQSRQALTEFADALPPAIFAGLNGGIVLLPDMVEDEHDLLILGEYHVDPDGLGRRVSIYYGSMVECFFDLSPSEFKSELRHTLHHELTHHLEDMAGDDSLGIQDELDLQNYLT